MAIAKRHPTQRQLVVLREISEFAAAHGFAPTIRELGVLLGLTSTNGVNDHLKALERHGLAQRNEQTARSLVITAAGRRLLDAASKRCRVCQRTAGASGFCEAHALEWCGSPEQRAVLRCLDVLGPLANEASRPHLGRALDAIIEAAHAVFADRVRSEAAR